MKGRASMAIDAARGDRRSGNAALTGTEGCTLQAGHIATPGACAAPIPVLPGQQVEADFGWTGTRFVRGDTP
jgi:2-keto-4-pentenoate hydratase